MHYASLCGRLATRLLLDAADTSPANRRGPENLKCVCLLLSLLFLLACR